jgi:hypothetical protein
MDENYAIVLCSVLIALGTYVFVVIVAGGKKGTKCAKETKMARRQEHLRQIQERKEEAWNEGDMVTFRLLQKQEETFIKEDWE